jgi:hypothetical protein
MEKEIFDCISKNEIVVLQTKLKTWNGDINFVDENGEKSTKNENPINLTKA